MKKLMSAGMKLLEEVSVIIENSFLKGFLALFSIEPKQRSGPGTLHERRMGHLRRLKRGRCERALFRYVAPSCSHAAGMRVVRGFSSLQGKSYGQSANMLRGRRPKRLFRYNPEDAR
jgi:hypothetical protein